LTKGFNNTIEMGRM